MPVRLSLRQTQDGCVEVDVLPPRELWVEPRAELEEGSDPSPCLDLSRGGTEDPADDLEECGLARAVHTDQAEGLSLVHVEGHVPQGPELFRARPPEPEEALLQAGGALVVDPEPLGDVADGDGPLAHYSSSEKSPAMRWKTHQVT